MYSGVRSLVVAGCVIEDVRTGRSSLPAEFLVDACPNEFLLLREDGESKPYVVRLLDLADGSVRVPTHGLCVPVSRNKEQVWAYDLLLDPSVSLVTLTGVAGCGKTLLSLAAGYQQLSSGTYDRMIVMRPIVPLGKDLGFLPGTLQEKMGPWVAPIHDNFAYVLDSRAKKKTKRAIDAQLRDLLSHGTVEIEAIPYIRGRSLPHAYIIVDEAQNIDLPGLKTILTRVAEGSKIVLTGDLDQIDRNIGDKSGLECVIERFKKHKLSGHVTLIRGERSALASLASEIL